MLEKFTRVDAGDFRQRYQGTFGYFRRGASRQLVRLDRVDTEHSRVTFVDAHGINYELFADSDDASIGFDFLPPKMAFHNTPSGTYLLRRVPQRQFSRGLSHRNVSIRSVCGEEIYINFSSLSDIFENPISPKDAFDRAWSLKPNTQERSFAISPQFACDFTYGRVFCFHDPIGTVTTTKAPMSSIQLVIKLTDRNLWGNEITDALSKASLNGVVV